MDYRDWYLNLRIPWFVGRTNGKAEGRALGKVLNDQAERIDAAIQARYAQKCHSDAVPIKAAERQLPQGYLETEDAWRLRLRQAWDAWKYASLPVGLLRALELDGYAPVLVQQNGLAYQLTAGAGEPLTRLTITNLSALTAPMTSNIDPTRTPIPVASPWWTFDSNIEHCSRYAVLLPSQPPFWMHKGTATFTASDSASVTWSSPFPSAVYSVLTGPPQTADGPVTVVVDPASKTTTGATVSASGLFTGTVDVLAWAAGENPFCCPDATALANLRLNVKLWAPAKKCMGIFALVQGKFFGWPLRTFGSGGTFGPASTTVEYAAEV